MVKQKRLEPHDWDCGEFVLIHQSRVKLQNAKENNPMLRNVNHLKGFAIQATDGEIGTVDQFYFDDESWAIRYLVVKIELIQIGRAHV